MNTARSPVAEGPQAAGRDARIEIVADPAVFAGLREEWNELLADSASDCLFLTWEWLHSWWNNLSGRRRLRILSVRRGGRLIAVAPLCLRPPRPARLMPFRVLEFLGSGTAGSDYLDLIVRRDVDGDEEDLALRTLEEFIAPAHLPIELGQVRSDGSSAGALGSRLGSRGWSLRRLPANVCPFIPLAGQTWHGYLNTLGSAHRYNFRRRLRNLEKEFEVHFEQVRTEEQRREALPILLSLHNRRRQGRGGSSAFNTRGLLAFHEEITRETLRRGWLRLFLLRLDGKPAASLYGFRYGPTFYFYQSGLDPAYGRQSVGLITMGLCIRAALEEGAEEFDLLHGDEAYKFLWARKARGLERFDLYPPCPCGRLCRCFAEGGRAVKGLVRRVFFRSSATWTGAGRTT